MRASSHPLFATALLGLAAAFAPPALGDDAGRLPLQYIDVLGRVSTAAGRSVEGVRVALEGLPEVAVVTDASGSYTLTVPVEALGDPAKKTVTVRVVAVRPGWGFTLRNGQGMFALELRVQTRTDPARCRVRSNVLQSVDAVAAAIRRGDRNAVVASVDFVGEEGASPSSRVALRSEAVTIVAEASGPEVAGPVATGDREPRERATVPRPVARDSTGRNGSVVPPPPGDAGEPPRARSADEPAGGRDAPAIESPRDPPQTTAPARTRVAPAREEPSSRSRIRRIDAQDGSRTPAPASDSADAGTIKLPGPGVTQTDASIIRRVETTPGAADVSNTPRGLDEVFAIDGGCTCRIRGTVEIHPDHLLTRRLDLIVALREAPSVRDTIQLFMGSPRAFELRPVRCGTWHVDVDAVAKRVFTIVSADGRAPVDCGDGGLRQLRIVLEPR